MVADAAALHAIWTESLFRSPHCQNSCALLLFYPIATYYLALASLAYLSASQIAKCRVSLFPFVKHLAASLWAATASDVVFGKYTNCLQNDFWFGYYRRNGQKSSFPSLTSSRLRCREDFAAGEISEKASPCLIEPGFSPATLLFSLMADIFLKRQDCMYRYYQATQSTTEFFHLYFCLRVTTVRYFSGFYA